MNKENKYTSLELSKKIYELAKKNGFELPESEMWWGNTIGQKDQTCWKLYTEEEKEIPDIAMEYYPAYDTSELGEMLPRMIKIDDKKVKNKHKKIIGIFRLHFYKNDYEWLLQYKEWHGTEGLIIVDAKTEAEARGKMFYYLLDNGLL